MDGTTFKNNLDVLWNKTDETLTCDKHNKLSSISSWNLIGRLINWIADRNGSVTRRIQEATQLTLEQVADENALKHWIYVRNSKHRAHSPYYPADYLANRITNSGKFNSTPIKLAAERILSQKDQYPAAHIPLSERDPRIESWRGGDYIIEEYPALPPKPAGPPPAPPVVQQTPIRVSLIRSPSNPETFNKEGREVRANAPVMDRIEIEGVAGNRFQLMLREPPIELAPGAMASVGLSADGIATMFVEDDVKRYLVRLPLSEISDRLLISKDLETAAREGKLDLLFQRKAEKMRNLPRLVEDYERLFEAHFRNNPDRLIGERVDAAGKASGGLSAKQIMKVVRTFHRTELAEGAKTARRITFHDLKDKYQLAKVEIVFTRDAGELKMTRYDDATLLGEGSFGIAYRVAQLDVNQILAAKKLKPFMDFETLAVATEGLRMEASLLREIHQNGQVPGIQDAPHVFTVIDEGPSKQAFYATVGTAYEGDAKGLIASPSWKTEPLREKLDCCRQILEGNKRLKELGILHLDQKPENIFYRKAGARYEVATADFGGAVKGSKATPNRVVHTPKYMPVNEIIQGADSRTVVYIVGATLFNLLTNDQSPWPLGAPGYPRYPDLTNPNAFNMNALTSQHVPDAVCQLIRQMCDPDPARRPTAAAAHARWVELMATV